MISSKGLNLYPLLRITLMFIIGIIVGDAWGKNLPLWLWLSLTAIVLAIGLGIGKKHEAGQGLCIMTCTLLLGVTLTCRTNHRLNSPLTGTTPQYKAIVMSEPEERGKTIRCDLTITHIGTQPLNTPIKVKASLLKDSVSKRWQRLHIGDGIETVSQLEVLKNFDTRSNFDYVRWLRTHGFAAQTFIFYRNWRKTAVSTTTLPRFDRLKLRALKLRQTFLEQYRLLGLEDEQYAVVAAMTLGDKSHLSKALKDRYSIAGASHVLALSGLHLGIIYAFLTLLLGRWRKWQWLSQAVILTAIWVYVGIVGMPASAIRSATMLSIYALCIVLGRQRASINTLAFAALMMLLVNPLNLWDIGFQMSFTAVAAILIYYPTIFHALPLSNAVARWLWGLTAVSLAAQIGTAPLVAYYFGRFSCYFILTNIIVIPAATMILYGALLMFLSIPFPTIQEVIVRGIVRISEFLNRSLDYLSGLPGASLEGRHLNTWQLFLTYVVIASLTIIGYYVHIARRQDKLDTFCST
ncbi:MAG: ComEC/Rec2 family competence protein [Prevotella sp.]|jgi:competence protein ComEC